jgi:hypothetical protein
MPGRIEPTRTETAGQEATEAGGTEPTIYENQENHGAAVQAATSGQSPSETGPTPNSSIGQNLADWSLGQNLTGSALWPTTTPLPSTNTGGAGVQGIGSDEESSNAETSPDGQWGSCHLQQQQNSQRRP